MTLIFACRDDKVGGQSQPNARTTIDLMNLMIRRPLFSCLGRLVMHDSIREDMLSLRPLSSSSSSPPMSTQQPDASGESASKLSKTLLPMGDYSDHDPQDEKFPSETTISSSPPHELEHPGMLYILGHASLMALLSCIIAGVGLAGMFFISDFLSQSIKILTSNSSNSGKARENKVSTAELARMLRERQVELREALQLARRERATTREKEIREETRLLREAAAIGSFGWVWR